MFTVHYLPSWILLALIIVFLLAAASIPFHSLKAQTVAGFMIPITALLVTTITAPFSMFMTETFDTYSEAADSTDIAWRTQVTVDTQDFTNHINATLDFDTVSYSDDVNTLFEDSPIYIQDKNTTRGYVNIEHEQIVFVPPIGDKISLTER